MVQGEMSRHARCGWAVATASLLLLPGCSFLPGYAAESPVREYQRQALEERTAARQAVIDEAEPPTSEEKVAEGDDLRRKGRNERAMMAYLEAVKLAPDASLPRERIGYVQLDHDLERAEAIFSGVLEKDPENVEALRGLSLAYLGQGKLEPARETLERAVEADPGAAGARYALGATMGLLGRRAEALEHTRRARELSPHDATIANGLGVAHMVMGHWTEAESAFRDAIRLDSRISAYYNNLGLALGRQERYEEALASFQKFGSEQAAQNNLGYVYYLNRRYDDAIAHYERALLAPGDQKVLILQNLNDALDARDGRASRPASAPE
jgi:tetratricopeptide (TPR) repeat protein